jgi:hypothetical protein
LVVSDFVSAEFSAVIGVRVRTKLLSESDAYLAFSNFDRWIKRSVLRVDMTSSDIGFAGTILRQLELALRAPDAIHLAIARRVGAELATFDKRMAVAARALGIGVVRT